jgi:hypothetical protein
MIEGMAISLHPANPIDRHQHDMEACIDMSRLLTLTIFGVALLAACGSNKSDNTTPIVDEPYETCYAGDVCSDGLTCAATTLPASSGYTGYFCTSGCTYNSDCVQLAGNYTAVCIDNQCYLSCPAGNATCPYDQGCFTFSSNMGSVALCTP